MNPSDPKTYLWTNIEALMGGGKQTVDAVQARTRASRGTIQRIKAAKTSVGIDLLMDIAKAFDIEIWELLTPRLPKSAPQSRPERLSLAHALEVVATTLASADSSTRELASGMLANLAKNPENHARIAMGLLAMMGNGGAQFETRVSMPTKDEEK